MLTTGATAAFDHLVVLKYAVDNSCEFNQDNSFNIAIENTGPFVGFL